MPVALDDKSEAKWWPGTPRHIGLTEHINANFICTFTLPFEPGARNFKSVCGPYPVHICAWTAQIQDLQSGGNKSRNNKRNCLTLHSHGSTVPETSIPKLCLNTPRSPPHLQPLGATPKGSSVLTSLTGRQHTTGEGRQLPDTLLTPMA